MKVFALMKMFAPSFRSTTVRPCLLLCWLECVVPLFLLPSSPHRTKSTFDSAPTTAATTVDLVHDSLKVGLPSPWEGRITARYDRANS